MSCCCCKLVFSTNEADRPYILPCKHSACFRCVKRNIKNGFLQCIPCENKCDLPVTNDPENIDNILPINFYLISQIYNNYDSFKKNVSPAFKWLPKPKTVTIKKCTDVKCAECIATNANLYCKQCNSKFCNNCFKRIHSFHSLRKHLKIPIKHLDYFYKFCSRHPETTVVYYCKKCSMYICTNCLVPGPDSCKDHDIVTDAYTSKKCDELNKHIVEDKMHLLNISSKLDESLKVCAINSQNTSMVKTFKNKIADSFSKAHNVLQVAEFDLLKKLTSFTYDANCDLMTDLTRNIDKLNEILDIMNVCFEPEYKDMINFEHLKEEIKKASEFPCQLENTIQSQDPTLLIDENLLSLMENYCQLVFPKSCSFKFNPLAKTCNPEIKLEIITEENTEEKNILREKPINVNVPNTGNTEEIFIEKLSQENISQLDEKSLKVPEKVKTKKKPKDFKTMEGFKGYVKDYVTGNQKKTDKQTNRTEMQNPAFKLPCFSDIKKGSSYNVNVTYARDPHDFYVQLVSMKPYLNQMSKKIKDTMTPFTTEDAFNSGEIVAFCDKAKDQYYRVEIIDPKKPVTESVKVNFVDFGHNDTVSISLLGSLEERYKKMPPLAMHCTLTDCKPISGKWNVDAVSLMHQLFKSCKHCIVYIKNTTNFKHEVNLTVRPTTPQYPIYLMRDALVFLGLAQMTDPKTKIKTTLKVPKNRIKDISKVNLKSNDEVQIVHVVSPEEFYLRKITCDKSFNELSVLLNNVYKIDNDVGFIPIPQIGYIVACYTDNLKWCRGRVELVVDNKTIQIFLVDYGKIIVISSNMIRELLDSFYEIEPMAVRCFLYGIKPNKDQWDSEATSILIKVSQSWIPSHIRVLTDHSCEIFGVHLYSCLNTEMTLINEYFVEKKLANYISLIPQDSNNSIENKEIPIDKDTKSLFANKIPVKILSVVNPSLIYVSLDSEAKKMAMLSGKMQEFYRNNPVSKSDWKNGDGCAALCPITKEWCRGVIEDVKGETCRVYFRDTSHVDDIQMDNIREIQENFSCLEDGAVKCSLSGILPASGNKWPNLSCEYLHEIVSTAEKFLIEKIGKIENEYSSVQLWGYCITPGTALDPQTEEWKRINELIIERGLAIRDPTIPLPNDKNEPICQENDSKPQSSSVTDSKFSSPNVETANFLTLEMPLSISNVKAWKPSLFPTKDFIGRPTYIDNEFNIYVFDSQNNTEILENINDLVARNFENSAAQPQDMFWHKDQPCIALYSLDSKYYRAEVLDILENNEVSVRFVDYGNVEVCSIFSLRKNLILTDIPVQTHKCRIVGVKPIGDEWKDETIDLIFKSIVEKECYINVLGTNKEEDILYIKLNIPSLSDLANLLVTLNLANYDDYPEIIELFPSTSDECHDNSNDDPDIIVVNDEKNCDALKEKDDPVHF